MSALAVTLSVAGGLFELGGLMLIVRGIGRDRAQAHRLFAPKRRERTPRRSYPPKVMPRRYPSFGSTGLRQSDQLRRIVEYVAEVDAAAYNNFVGMRKALDAELDRSVADLRNNLAEADNQLREHLRYVLAGSIRDRVIGALLLGAGIVLAAAGSVTGTLAT